MTFPNLVIIDKYLSHIQVLQKFRLGRDYVQKGRFAKQSAVESNFRIPSESTEAPNCFVQSLNGSLQLPYFDSNNKNKKIELMCFAKRNKL